jgi:hypothetical protein
MRWDAGDFWAFSVVDGAFWEAESPVVAAGDATYLIAYEGDAPGNPTVDRHVYGRILAGGLVYLPLVVSDG